MQGEPLAQDASRPSYRGKPPLPVQAQLSDILAISDTGAHTELHVGKKTWSTPELGLVTLFLPGLNEPFRGYITKNFSGR